MTVYKTSLVPRPLPAFTWKAGGPVPYQATANTWLLHCKDQLLALILLLDGRMHSRTPFLNLQSIGLHSVEIKGCGLWNYTPNTHSSISANIHWVPIFVWQSLNAHQVVRSISLVCNLRMCHQIPNTTINCLKLIARRLHRVKHTSGHSWRSFSP